VVVAFGGVIIYNTSVRSIDLLFIEKGDDYMPTCKYCGREFNLGYARRSIGQRYGAGTYNDYYSDADVCENCAVEEISCDYATGAEMMELMGAGWDD